MVSHRQAKQQQRRRTRQLRCELLERRHLLTGGLPIDPATAWQALAAIPPSPTGAPSYLSVDKFTPWQLDTALVRAQLATAPLEFTAASDQRLTFAVPGPTGELAHFALVESPIMEPALAALFPEIKTYAGQGIDDPAATIRLDLTPQGFHAQVLSPSGTFYVDPYYHLEDRVYVSYFRSDVDAAARQNEHEFVLGTEDRVTIASAVVYGPTPLSEVTERSAAIEESAEAALLASRQFEAAQRTGSAGSVASAGEDVPAAQRSGTQLRTYRAAVAATAEYTAFHGGTVALGQAAVVTAMNRVTGVYESELSIRLTLVAGNDLLIYTDAANDPYTNDNPNSLLTQNQANIDSRIGTANYDIGHVFSTGGGGLAASGVGVASRKAQGETGSPSPIGDSFYIDYVVHEIGHQFDANHSWSGTTGACSTDNFAYETGAEPGSGTTIMSYAGICGVDNIAAHADANFHAINFDEIINYVDNVIPSVGTRTATGNTVPTANAGSDYVIPASTPFVLTASGSDANSGDVLSYSWEEMDAGAQKLLASTDNGTSALFRSRPPTASPVRYFPPLSNVLAGTNATGETLPTGGRTLNFRVTVRDNRSGGGGVNTDDARVKVVNTGAAFRVTSPNTAVHWAAKSTQLVTWNVAGTNGNGINALQVNILLSTDGGLTFPTVLASATANDGAQLVNLPALSTSSTARIRIEPVGNIFYDVSDINFFIDAAAAEQTDFGDAPNSYGTLLGSNGARHAIGGPRLGNLIDGEANGVPASTASGDGSDDDGVAISALIAGQETAIRVYSSTAGAKLDYFFDFDGNGVFGNQANEVFAATLTAGSQVIAVAVPPTATAGNTFARFRISTAGALGPTGTAADGEVEDYAVTIFADAPALDFGDAPVSYATTSGSVGPSHFPVGPRLGSVVDAEADGIATSLSSGDGADEDGVKFTQLLVPGASTSISVTASQAGMLNYFFDFDGSGVFGDNPNESFQTAVTAGVNTLTVAVPPAAIIGNFAARFRISTAGNLLPYGFAVDGEVEDYQVRTITTAVVAAFQNFDSVTTPALPAGWVSASTVSGGAARNWTTISTGSDSAPNHAFVAGAAYVSTNSLTSAPFVLTTANQQLRLQHSYGFEYFYDGGVLEVSTNGTTFTDFVTAGGTFLSGGYTSTLGSGSTLASRNAWSGLSSGYFETVLQFPASLLGQTIYLRWIEGTDNRTADFGWRVDSIQAVRTALAFDYGDAPSPYPTLSAASGAAHAEETSLRLGANFDSEANGVANATAAGDDSGGIDDEDGVTFAGVIQQGGIGSVSVVASGAGLLQGWIDFNDDGDWSDAGEQIFSDQAVVAGTNNLTFAVGAGAVATSQTFARFRLSSQGGLTFTGQAPDGEVEDYQVAIFTPATFLVTGVTSTTTGVIVDFNRDLDRQVLNLYDANSSYGAADLTLVGAANGAVRGSIVIDANNRRLTFVASNGRLPPDNYTLTLRSAANSFRDYTFIMLDGDLNGSPGGDFVSTFTVNVPAANTVTIGLPDFARGPQQAVNLPANSSSGIPISLSNGDGVTSATFELRYNPALLTITSAAVAPGLPVGASVSVNTSTSGVAVFSFTSPTPLLAGTTRFVDVQASVPATATYKTKQLLDLTNVVLNGGAIPALDDDALQVVAYFGDVTANGDYTGTDASYIARNAVSIDTGFAAFPLLDPLIIGDLTGKSGISAQDTSLAMQLAVVIPVAEVPALPSPGISLAFGGPDPKLSIPATLTARAGDAIDIPVNLDSIVDLTGNGLRSAELVIYYDASLLDVQDVVLGKLVSGRSDWFVAARIDQAAGRVFISVAGQTPLDGRFAGELVQLQARVKAESPSGATPLNIAAWARTPTFRTQLNEGYLTLIPAPTDRPDDVGVDGVLTIVSPASTATALLVNGRLQVAGTNQSDRIYLSESGGLIRVRVNNRWLGDFAMPQSIVIRGGAGQDYIVAAIAVPTEFDSTGDEFAASDLVFASDLLRDALGL
ncbi:GEVED domain-containing protein [Anatilimnocola floriformis]|uniref:GEVED domain-containing protein n=1 Tax=Anatilimnocola floriformis TaxID=2948575 RepID=UPI0020C25BE3|nr:GEVED domain-containing protein [Anatilimnocola floriformis]